MLDYNPDETLGGIAGENIKLGQLLFEDEETGLIYLLDPSRPSQKRMLAGISVSEADKGQIVRYVPGGVVYGGHLPAELEPRD